jgi:signal transduction histidine kinase
MRSLVEGLLTLARADSGELPVRRVAVQLDRLVDETLDLLRPLAQQRGVTLQFSPQAASVTGDPDRLQELLSNLLSNGLAYSRPDGLVSVALQHEGSDVVLTVRDDGIGIGPEDLPRIFDRFYRADPARTREPAGAGLGLAIAQWIVTAHGGSISCTSELGRYTAFVVRLPGASGTTSTLRGETAGSSRPR